jgi:hypothetical protein
MEGMVVLIGGVVCLLACRVLVVGRKLVEMKRVRSVDWRRKNLLFCCSSIYFLYLITMPITVKMVPNDYDHYLLLANITSGAP